MILHNNMASFYASVASSFFYLTGHTMRGMAMSLVNRPFIQNEMKSDTQSVIDQRMISFVVTIVGMDTMKSRFIAVFVYPSSIRNKLLDCLLHILNSDFTYSHCFLFNRQSTQSVLSFLVVILPMVEEYLSIEFCSSLFVTLLHLYLTTQGDRCVHTSLFYHL